MLEETHSKLLRTIKDLENKLEAMTERARVAENKNQEIGVLKSTIQSMHDEIQHRAMRENSLQVPITHSFQLFNPLATASCPPRIYTKIGQMCEKIGQKTGI